MLAEDGVPVTPKQARDALVKTVADDGYVNYRAALELINPGAYGEEEKPS